MTTSSWAMQNLERNLYGAFGCLWLRQRPAGGFHLRQSHRVGQ